MKRDEVLRRYRALAELPNPPGEFIPSGGIGVARLDADFRSPPLLSSRSSASTGGRKNRRAHHRDRSEDGSAVFGLFTRRVRRAPFMNADAIALKLEPVAIVPVVSRPPPLIGSRGGDVFVEIGALEAHHSLAETAAVEPSFGNLRLRIARCANHGARRRLARRIAQRFLKHRRRYAGDSDGSLVSRCDG